MFFKPGRFGSGHRALIFCAISPDGVFRRLAGIIFSQLGLVAVTHRGSPGAVTGYHAPGGMGVRVDSALYQGYTVPPHYDSLIAKLIVHGTSRNECLMRLRRALEEYVIAGIETTIPLHQRLVAEAEFINGDYDIHWLERFLAPR